MPRPADPVDPYRPAAPGHTDRPDALGDAHHPAAPRGTHRPGAAVRNPRATALRSRGRLLAAVVAVAALTVASARTTPTPGSGPPPAAPAEVTSTPPLAASRPVHLRIPSIGTDSTLVELGLRDDGTLQVPTDGTAAGWYTGSPSPGQTGPAIIAAHVDWNHRPGPFYRLDELERGDEVDVDRQDGVTARFEVLEVEQYPKDAFPTERVYGDIDHAGLRLITCGGDFDRTARSYRDNVVVYAGLIGSRPARR